MWLQDSHPADEQLLLNLEGELSARQSGKILKHLSACWKCRVRSQELGTAVTDFVHLQQQLSEILPPVAGPRALLKARLAQSRNNRPASSMFPLRLASIALAACAIASFGFVWHKSEPAVRLAIVFVPDARLTPGATVLSGWREVCSQANTRDRAVPAVLQRKVFEEYRITGAEPRAYDVDYLISPALGGADDIHNLWPQSHSSTVWNAQVKDALEDQLREMVCSGDLDLVEAQRQIAGDWIGAYRKYFHTELPLPGHSTTQYR